jgi:hypothetical protein
MLWHYAEGRPKDEVESAQKIEFTWVRPDWLTTDRRIGAAVRLVREDAAAAAAGDAILRHVEVHLP